MRNDMNELEQHALFINPIKNLKFEIDELNKMLESRLNLLTRHVCENELNAAAYKNIKSEVFRAIDGSTNLCNLIYQELTNNLEKSFNQLEEYEEVNK